MRALTRSLPCRCLFKDGDAANNGSWKGGSYSQYQIEDNTLVAVTFDAEAHSISFTVTRPDGSSQERPDCYTGLPDQVFLA
eukprot:SAG11_NODE_29557_length_309_cov_1.438095_1_plen_80_part_10